MQVINLMACLTFLFLWAAVFIYIGTPELYKMLGGSGWIFYLLPVIPVVSLKYQFLSKLIWGVLCTLVAMVAINYLHSYFLLNEINFSFLIKPYVIFSPISLMLVGYIYAVYYFVDFKGAELFDQNRYIEILNKFNIFTLTALFASIGTFQIFIMIDTLSGLNYISNSQGFNVAMSGLIVGALIFSIEVSRIPIKVFNFFSRPIQRFEYDYRKIKKWALIGSLIFIVFSAHWELVYRRHWGIWVETTAAFFILVYLLYKFGRIHFTSLPSRTQAPDEKYMPLIKARRIIIIVLIYFVVYVALIAAVLKGYARYLVF